MVLPELSLELGQPMAYATLKTVNRLVRKHLHLNHVVSQRTKGGINLYIKRHKLDQIDARNI